MRLSELARRRSFRLMVFAGWLLLSLLPVRDMFRSDMPITHDAEHHVFRTIALADIWNNGYFIPRWAPSLGGGLGYPVFMYNGWFTAAVSANLFRSGMAPVAATNAVFVLAALISAAGAWLLGKQISGIRGGWTLWGLYHFAPYQIVDIYVRYALAEYFAGALAPWLFLGLLLVYREKTGSRGFIIAVAAASLLILTHNIGSFMFLTGAAAFATAVCLSGSHEHGKHFVRYILAAGVVLGITAFFWIPILVGRHDVMLENIYAERFRYDRQFLYWNQLIVPWWGYGPSIPGPNDGFSFQVGIVQWIVLLLSAGTCFTVRKTAVRLQIILLAVSVVGMIFLTTYTSAFLWRIFPPLRILHLPWRLLLPITFGIGWLGAVLVGELSLRFPRISRAWSLLPVAAVAATLPYAHVKSAIPLDLRTLRTRMMREYITTTAMDEYRPRTASDLSLTYRRKGPFAKIHLQNPGNRMIAEPVPSRRADMKFSVLTTAPGTMTLPVFYFPGWEARVNGRRTDTSATRTGLLLLNIPAGETKVHVYRRATAVQSNSMIVSIVSLVIFVLGLGAISLRNNKLAVPRPLEFTPDLPLGHER